MEGERGGGDQKSATGVRGAKADEMEDEIRKEDWKRERTRQEERRAGGGGGGN